MKRRPDPRCLGRGRWWPLVVAERAQREALADARHERHEFQIGNCERCEVQYG